MAPIILLQTIANCREEDIRVGLFDPSYSNSLLPDVAHFRRRLPVVDPRGSRGGAKILTVTHSGVVKRCRYGGRGGFESFFGTLPHGGGSRHVTWQLKGRTYVKRTILT